MPTYTHMSARMQSTGTCATLWHDVLLRHTHLPVLVPDIWEARGTPPSREGFRPAPVALCVSELVRSMALSVTATERPSWKDEDTLEMSLRALDSLARSLCL